MMKSDWPTQLARLSLVFLILLLGISLYASAQQAVPVAHTLTPSVQRGSITSTQSTAAANTPVVVGFGAANGVRGHLYSITARCSAGTASITVENPTGTTIWSTPAAAVSTTNFEKAWNPGLTSNTIATEVKITLSTCGLGNTGLLMIQADVF